MTVPTIVVATDLSENSKGAERAGAKLAAQWNAEVILVHCFDPQPAVPPMAIPSIAKLEAQIEQEMRQAIQKRLEQIRLEVFDGVRAIEFEVRRTHSPAVGVCDLARDKGADWIVVGTHGRTGVGRMLIGSVAENIVRHAPCSVAVIREEDPRANERA